MAVGETSSTVASEAEMRIRVNLNDIEEWGIPREIVGRLSTIKFLNPLGEDALRSIVRGNKQDEYSAMLPGSGSFSIDSAAEDILVRNALTTHYGARSINQQLNELFCGAIWHEVGEVGAVASVTLTASGNVLDFRIEEESDTHAGKKVVSTESDRLSARAAYGLLREIRTHVETCGGKPTLDPHLTLGTGRAEYAASLLCQDGRVVIREEGPYIPNDFSLAEVTLLYALISLLMDWLPASDRTPDGLRRLLSLADFGRSGNSPLDLLFRQLQHGMRYVPNQDHDPTDPSSQPWIWTKSLLVRVNDGLCPGEKGGLTPGEDDALDYYSEFRGYPPESRQQAVSNLAFRLL
jgi:hypothetical protein